MPPLPVLRSREVIAALKRAGFSVRSGKGSHVKLYRGTRFCVVPNHPGRDLKPGTLNAIIDQSGLTLEEFLEPLDR